MSAEAYAALSQAERDVLAERRREVEVEGFTAEHDDGNYRGQMAMAAASYAMNAAEATKSGSLGAVDIECMHAEAPAPDTWPWHRGWWKPKTRRAALVKAGALIIAEIERLDRRAAR